MSYRDITDTMNTVQAQRINTLCEQNEGFLSRVCKTAKRDYWLHYLTVSRIPLDKCSWNFYIWFFSKYVNKIQVSLKS